jgi:UDP-N-acetylenolpyruvoylglucosamine reductase
MLVDIYKGRLAWQTPLAEMTSYGWVGRPRLAGTGFTRRIVQALTFVRRTKTPFFILGGGSNVLFGTAALTAS